MTQLHSIARAVSDELRSRIHFCQRTGQIWLHEHRMLLVHAEAQALLRKELIDTLGLERARGLLTRMGYASGLRDAELARTQSQDCSDVEAFMTGPRLHTLEGIVQTTPVQLELDRMTGRFYGEFLWENSWEGQWHRHHYGVHDEPVCWTQIGYACGYASAFMGRPILFKEVECAGMGNPNCRIIGRPAQEWDDAEEHLRYFTPESIADQLIELQTQVVQLRSTICEKANLPGEMIGNSPGFRRAFELLRKAANSHITVLLLGETGVGKELFARALHAMGERREQPFVAVNCAAIPTELVESELFGVERGAYTGAQVARAGRFERADGGTLFLDEVGDLPLAAQSKLLRVLQEGQFERVGDDHTHSVDVRVIAATNRSLASDGKSTRFRPDLYYRLSVFPIQAPPLRDRRDDIPALALHFLAAAAKRLGLPPATLKQRHVQELQAYPWPGNIRELQNVIERAVITSQGRDLEFELHSNRAPESPSPAPALRPASRSGETPILTEREMKALERENIVRALEQTNWKVGGERGAAALLGMKPTTLASRMQVMGIVRG